MSPAFLQDRESGPHPRTLLNMRHGPGVTWSGSLLGIGIPTLLGPSQPFSHMRVASTPVLHCFPEFPGRVIVVYMTVKKTLVKKGTARPAKGKKIQTKKAALKKAPARANAKRDAGSAKKKATSKKLPAKKIRPEKHRPKRRQKRRGKKRRHVKHIG